MTFANDKQVLAWQDKRIPFEAYLRQSGLAQDTINAYVRDVEKFLTWLTKQTKQEAPTIEFTESDVEAYKRYLLDTVERSPASINRNLQSLRKYGRFMLATEGINPVQDVSLLEGSGSNPPITLTEAEVDRLISVVQTRSARTAVRDFVILQLLLQTGIRVSELVNLRLSDVEPCQDGTILIIRRQEKRLSRKIPLNARSCEVMESYMQQPHSSDNSYLFVGREGKPLSARSVQQIIKNLGEIAGIDISAKVLRNTYAKSLWQETTDLSLLAQRMGYRNVESALRHIIMTPK
jgi:integrase/recombinase XerD